MLRLPLSVALALALAAAPASAITLDGHLDAAYGTSLATQALATPADNLLGSSQFANGTELDELYALVEDGVLYLFVTGNQLAVYNVSDPGFFADHLHLFFDTRPGGQHSLRADNFDLGPFPGHSALTAMAGLTFETGFAADWYLGEILFDPAITGVGPIRLFAWRAELLDEGGGEGEYLGETQSGSSAGLTGGTNPLDVRAAFDNSNVAGVPQGCAAASGAGATTGIEWAIPLAALGNPEGCVRVFAFVTYKGASHSPNQALPSYPPGLCGFVGPIGALDFSALAGEQALTICGTSVPAMRSSWGRVKSYYR